jgi:hypothetical protein
LPSFPKGVGPRESPSNSYLSLSHLPLKLEFKGVRRESRDFLFLIHRHRRINKIPTKATPPITPPITEPTFAFEFEVILADAVAEDCAGLCPACVGELNPIVDAIAWLEYTLRIVGVVVTLAGLCATAMGAFDERSEGVVGKVVAADAEEMGAGTARSAA